VSARPALTLVQNLVDDNGELVGCPHCNEARAECEIWERRVLQLEAALKRATEDKDARLRNDKDYPAAADLFDEWRRECGHPNAKFDTARINLALRAIRRYGQTNREALSMVIQHGKHLAWVNPKTGAKKDGFGLLFRDSEQIEARANEFARWARRNGRAA
jgi:uncharacterized protein with PIN domain